jgi:7-cyano-7-deazaguanine synthase
VKTIVLLSGGLDSATVLAACVHDGQCLGLGFMYGQRHGQIEQTRAESLARHYDVRFEQVFLPTMPKTNDLVFAGRNLVFASVAISIAQAKGYDRIAFGCNASDWQEFLDCRPEFWGNVRRCGDTYGVEVLTPLIYFSKRDVVEMARKLKVPIDMTWSCYDPKGFEPCGECLACKTRNEALAA